MSDYLVNLANDKVTAQLVKTLGLPTPARLRRGGTEDAAPLGGGVFLSVSLPGSHVRRALSAALKALGAQVVASLPEDDSRLQGVVLDATGCRTPDDLHGLYDVFHPLMRRLERCARIVVLAAVPAEATTPAAAAARGIEGFVRALAKEVGKRGATANTLYVAKGPRPGSTAPCVFSAATERPTSPVRR